MGKLWCYIVSRTYLVFSLFILYYNFTLRSKFHYNVHQVHAKLTIIDFYRPNKTMNNNRKEAKCSQHRLTHITLCCIGSSRTWRKRSLYLRQHRPIIVESDYPEGYENWSAVQISFPTHLLTQFRHLSDQRPFIADTCLRYPRPISDEDHRIDVAPAMTLLITSKEGVFRDSRGVVGFKYRIRCQFLDRSLTASSFVRGIKNELCLIGSEGICKRLDIQMDIVSASQKQSRTSLRVIHFVL